MIEHTEYRNPVEVLAEEFLDRRRRGESASVEEYMAAHPESAAEIQNLFPAMLAIEQFKSCKLSSSGTPVEMRIEKVEQLGDYRIIREIGRGGMGVVYEAEQRSLGRCVAVKVFPRQTLSSSRQLERFHSEARTAAGLHHTNIVPIFGVGEQDGLHYFVMQRIRGRTLADVIDADLRLQDRSKRSGFRVDTAALAAASTDISRDVEDNDSDEDERECSAASSQEKNGNSPTELHTTAAGRGIGDQWREIAEIGIQVAQALSYAHTHGVLHRDIKPSNLLLDPQGTVWVADFGLATVLGSGQTVRSGDVAGTLRFMAPEHIDGEQDARSDIYSLGVTLYELLTTRAAFDNDSRAKLIQSIRQGNAVPPRTLRPEIPRDLEAIVLKSMSVEPRRRYSGADAFASDLRRFVDGRPVHARRISPVGRALRWIRRNPAVSSLSAALLLVVICSFIMISTKWREAVVESVRAEDNLSLALESMDQILERFGSSWMAHPIATQEDGVVNSVEFQVAVSDHSAAVLQDALRFYDRFAAQNSTNPQLQRDTAKVHRRVADIYERLGQYGKAEQAYTRSLEILDSEELNDDLTLAVEMAGTLNQLGLTKYATSRFSEAEAEFRRAKTLLAASSGGDDPGCQAELARTNNNLGQALWLMGKPDQARRSHREAVQIMQKVVEQHADDADFRLALARAYRVYYPFVLGGQRHSDYKRIRSTGIAILEELVKDFPDVPDYQCELSEMLATTSCCPLNSKGRDERAEQLQRAVTLAEALSTKHPSIPRYRAVHARTLKELGDAQRKSQRLAADRYYSKSVGLYRSLTRSFADIPAYHLFLASALRDHAENLRKLGHAVKSREAIQEGITEQKAYVALRPDHPFGEMMLKRLYEELARVQKHLGDAKAAQQSEQKANQLRWSFDKSGSDCS
jgi:eukaryotic-like serine/threonine-protein kinase